MIRRAALSLCLFGALAEPAAALERATADRPDDVTGAQIHAVYAIPSDGVDRALDTSGAVALSLERTVSWLAGETGGPTLRVDTSGGEIDVTFIRLTRTDAEIAARGAFVREELEAQLDGADLGRPDKVYAVYYDGGSTWSCGGGAWPPTIVGGVAAMYLRGTPPGAPPCSSNAFPGAPGYFEFGMLHEILHTLGFVAQCAPHHTRAGHASDSANDLMWAGDAPWLLPPRLDIGRDDYYGHGRADCPDLARSEYMAAPAPPAPPVAVTTASVGRARAGRVLTATLRLTVDGVAPPTAVVTCAARVRSLRLRGRAVYAPGKATCRWLVPRSLAGRRLAGTITVAAGGATARHSFKRTIARR